MRFRKDFAAAACATLLFLLLLEAGLRVAGVEYQGSFFEDDPVTGFAFRPNAEGLWTGENRSYLRINSLGMRDTDRTLAKPRGCLRIAILGDSHASNVLVPLESNMAMVLQRLLSRTGPTEVLNFGVDGFSVAQTYLSLRYKVIAFRPDIVIVIVTPHSVLTATRALYPYDTSTPFFRLQDGALQLQQETAPRAPGKMRRAFESRFWQAHNEIRLLQVGNHAIRNLSEIFARHNPWKEQQPGWALDADPGMMAVKPPAHMEMETAWRITTALFSKMQQLAKENHFELWIVSAGHPMQISLQEPERIRFSQMTGGSGPDYADTRYKAMADSLGIRFIDLVPPMLAYTIRHRTRLRGFPSRPPDTGHWNVAGNAVAAQVLAREIIASRCKQVHCSVNAR